MIRTLLILISFCVNFILFSQEIKTIGTPQADQAKVIVTSNNGNLILGETIKNNKKSLLLYFSDNKGGITWSKIISAEHPLVINDALKTNDGYILAAENYVSSRESLLLMSISESGEPNWVNTFNEEGNEVEPYAIEASPTAYYIGGFTKLATTAVNSFYNYSVENQFPYLLKTDKNGAKLWAKQLVLKNNKVAGEIRDVALTEDNNILIIANIYNPESKSKSISNYLIELNEEGAINWSKSIENSTTELMKIKLDSEGNIYLTGKHTISENNIDVSVIKLTNKGETLWSTSFGADRIEIPIDLELNNGQVYLSTSSNSFDDKKRSQALILHLDNNGNLKDSKYIEGLDFSKIASIKSNEDEIVYSGSIINFSKNITMNTISGNINDLSSSGKFLLNQNKIIIEFIESNISITEVKGEVNPNNIITNYKVHVNEEKLFIKNL